MSSQVVGNLYTEKSLAVVSSAMLFAMIDTFIAKKLLDEADVQAILQRARSCVARRHGSICAGESVELLGVLTERFTRACADVVANA